MFFNLFACFGHRSYLKECEWSVPLVKRLTFSPLCFSHIFHMFVHCAASSTSSPSPYRSGKREKRKRTEKGFIVSACVYLFFSCSAVEKRYNEWKEKQCRSLSLSLSSSVRSVHSHWYRPIVAFASDYVQKSLFPRLHRHHHRRSHRIIEMKSSLWPIENRRVKVLKKNEIILRSIDNGVLPRL